MVGGGVDGIDKERMEEGVCSRDSGVWVGDEHERQQIVACWVQTRDGELEGSDLFGPPP